MKMVPQLKLLSMDKSMSYPIHYNLINISKNNEI